MMSFNQNLENSEIIKVILVGNSGVGKTSIINRFYNNSFYELMNSTIVMNHVNKIIQIKGKSVILNVWDTAGQEQYKSCNKLFIKNSNIVILVYDITDKKSFDDLEYWYDFIRKELGETPLIALVGNKNDLMEDEQVDEELGKECAIKWDAFFTLLSAKENEKGIQSFFEKITGLYLGGKHRVYERRNSFILTKNNNNKVIEDNGGCCGGGKNKKSTKNKGLKIVFMGDKRVGKTYIIEALRGKERSKKYVHTKSITKNKYICQLENKNNINVDIIDTNEECLIKKEFKEILEKCKIYFLVFDINKIGTLNYLNNLINIIKKDIKEKVYINIIGNKKKKNIFDINDEDNFSTVDEEAKKLAQKYEAFYQLISIEDINSLQILVKFNIEKYLYY